MTSIWRPNKVFYHGPCVDGLTAATMARQALGADNSTYEEVSYGKPFPEFDATDASVYILDFCPPVEVLERILRNDCRNLYVFDHHVTAQDDIRAAHRRLVD